MYKAINQRQLILSKVIGVVVTLFLVSACSPRDLSQPNLNRKFGILGEQPFYSTFYYVVNESSYSDVQDSVLKNMLGDEIAKVNSKFKKDLVMEGTGILRSGKTVNYAGMIDGEIRFKFVKYKWGIGVGTCELRPYRTIAVDPDIIPFGTVVYIPAVKGMRLPDGSIHNGVFLAEDRGSAINNHHIDFFAQEGVSSMKPYYTVGVETGSHVEVFKVADPDPHGCHTEQPTKAHVSPYPFPNLIHFPPDLR